MRKILILLLLIMTFALQGDELSFWTDKPPSILAEELVFRMSDEEVLSQVFMIGYYGEYPSARFFQWIAERNLGGVKIFGWNGNNLPSLGKSISALQTKASDTEFGIPLIIATDQEGGWVRHIKGETSQTAGNLALGASGLPYDSYRMGKIIAKEMKTLGINMNFAPTVDVYTNPQAHVIGPRAFSDDPAVVGVLGTAFFRGMEDEGIISTAKHFPGHGNADKDSHGALPLIDRTFEELESIDLLPYTYMIQEGLPAIMTGHLGFPAILGDNTPASLSFYFVTDLLRDKMGFEGLVVTDDLRMAGAQIPGYHFVQICEAALRAGNDMIMISNDMSQYSAAWNHLLNKMETDPAFREIIKTAAKRIIRIKAEYLKRDNSVPLYPDEQEISNYSPSEEDQQFIFNQACRSVSILRGDGTPLETEGKRVLLAGQLGAFFSEGIKRIPQADTYRFSYAPFYGSNDSETQYLKRIASSYDLVIVCMATPGSADLVQALEPVREKLVVFSVLTPVYLQKMPWVERAIAAFGTMKESFTAGFAVLMGDFSPEGELPSTITDPKPTESN